MKNRLLILALLVVVLGVFSLVFLPKLLIPLLFEKKIQDLQEGIEDWLSANLQDDGLFVYSLNPETGEYSSDNNEVRQLMTSHTLAQISQTDSRLLPLHEKNLTTWIANWYREDDGLGYVLYDEESKLGANAALLRTISASPLFEEHADTAQAVANGILKLQNKDGSLEPWYVEPDYEYDRASLLAYYTGEALVALLEYYEKVGDVNYLNAASKSAQFYLSLYVDNLEENYSTSYVAWHTIAYNRLFQITGEQRYADAIFTLNDKLLELQDTAYYVGRFCKSEITSNCASHSASDGVYTEGLVYAYEVAEMVGDKSHSRRYLEAIKLSVKNLSGLQYREPLPESPLPFEAYRGAIRTNVDNPWVRIDSIHHAADALLYLTEVLK